MSTLKYLKMTENRPLKGAIDPFGARSTSSNVQNRLSTPRLALLQQAPRTETKIMDITTIYVGQGALAVVRHQGAAIIVDTHLPSSDRKLRDRIETDLSLSLYDHRVAGLVLTGFDADHSSPEGVKLILRYRRDVRRRCVSGYGRGSPLRQGCCELVSALGDGEVRVATFGRSTCLTTRGVGCVRRE